MSQANVVKHALMASGVSGDGFMLRNYDLLQSMLGHSALGVGAATGGWSKHLTEVQQTLEKIEALHKSHLAHGGHGARNDFLAKRAELFKTLEAQLKGMGRYGSGLRTNTSIKKMLKISTRSYQHQGEIKQYAAKVRNVARVAKQLKMGNYVGWALSTASSLLEIEEACSTGREEQCRNAKFVEGAKLVTSIFLSTAAGGLGAVGGKAVCAAIGIPSAGTGLAICVIVGGSVGGFAGGELGIAEVSTWEIFFMRPLKNEILHRRANAHRAYHSRRHKLYSPAILFIFQTQNFRSRAKAFWHNHS
ncbi:hypothetical protein PMM47T1_06086 [Pseudomonas sp. M47T1]|uniref:hypothetical protein n=1 Tax=Pseudomonas sp. M47T1 TaxID=1179778 RepID=UPI0002607842|nr:hypothetical protein [Pseudomonas sp. M47T1]EIK97330.1 hypothetical protein PMM47T1_06086 [Pseudomonas sp. M47T1]